MPALSLPLVAWVALVQPAAAGVGLSAASVVVGEASSSGWYQLRPGGSLGVDIGDRWRVGMGLAAAVPRKTERPGFSHTRTWSRASVGLSWAGGGSVARFVVTAGPALTVQRTRWHEPEAVVATDVGLGGLLALGLELSVGQSLRLGVRSAASSRISSVDFDAGVALERWW